MFFGRVVMAYLLDGHDIGVALHSKVHKRGNVLASGMDVFIPIPCCARQCPCNAAFGRKWDPSSAACRFEKASIWANRNVNDEPDGILARDVGHRLQESIRGGRDMG